MKSKFLILAAILAMALMAAPALAITVTGTVPGGPVSSSADFDFTTPGAVTVTLHNLTSVANFKNVGQALSDFGFVLTGITAAPTGYSSSGVERTVAADKSFTDGSAVATGWELTSGFNFSLLQKTFSTERGISGIGYYLNGLGTDTAPSHTIITDGPYTNVNASIAGNDPHTPFLAGDVSFTLDIPGVNCSTGVQYVLFSYGTTPSGVVPIPPSALLMGSGLLGLGLVGWRRKKD
jgi:hypothetical protein